MSYHILAESDQSLLRENRTQKGLELVFKAYSPSDLEYAYLRDIGIKHPRGDRSRYFVDLKRGHPAGLVRFLEEAQTILSTGGSLLDVPLSPGYEPAVENIDAGKFFYVSFYVKDGAQSDYHPRVLFEPNKLAARYLAEVYGKSTFGEALDHTSLYKYKRRGKSALAANQVITGPFYHPLASTSAEPPKTTEDQPEISNPDSFEDYWEQWTQKPGWEANPLAVGFDKAGFEGSQSFLDLCQQHKIYPSPVVTVMKGEHIGAVLWKGPGLKMVTAGNPIEQAGRAYYIGVEGQRNKVLPLAKDITLATGSIAELGLDYIGFDHPEFEKVLEPNGGAYRLTFPEYYQTFRSKHEEDTPQQETLYRGRHAQDLLSAYLLGKAVPTHAWQSNPLLDAEPFAIHYPQYPTGPFVGNLRAYLRRLSVSTADEIHHRNGKVAGYVMPYQGAWLVTDREPGPISEDPRLAIIGPKAEVLAVAQAIKAETGRLPMWGSGDFPAHVYRNVAAWNELTFDQRPAYSLAYSNWLTRELLHTPYGDEFGWAWEEAKQGQYQRKVLDAWLQSGASQRKKKVAPEALLSLPGFNQEQARLEFKGPRFPTSEKFMAFRRHHDLEYQYRVVDPYANQNQGEQFLYGNDYCQMICFHNPLLHQGQAKFIGLQGDWEVIQDMAMDLESITEVKAEVSTGMVEFDHPRLVDTIPPKAIRAQKRGPWKLTRGDFRDTLAWENPTLSHDVPAWEREVEYHYVQAVMGAFLSGYQLPPNAFQAVGQPESGRLQLGFDRGEPLTEVQLNQLVTDHAFKVVGQRVTKSTSQGAENHAYQWVSQGLRMVSEYDPSQQHGRLGYLALEGEPEAVRALGLDLEAVTRETPTWGHDYLGMDYHPPSWHPPSAKENDLGYPEYLDLLISRFFDAYRDHRRLTKSQIEAIGEELGISKRALWEGAELSWFLWYQRLYQSGGRFDSILKQMITFWKEVQPTYAYADSSKEEYNQYSTPCPIAAIMAEYTGMGSAQKVFEPSAGNGLLLIGAKPGRVHANELDATRLHSLRYLGYKTITQQNAAFPFPSSMAADFDVVVSNPPFGEWEENQKVRKLIAQEIFLGMAGTATHLRLEHVMVGIALSKMKDTGKAAMIIGRHQKFNREGQPNHKVFMNWLHRHYYVDDVINLNSYQLYHKQGTVFPLRLILIAGRKLIPNGLAPRYQEVPHQKELVHTLEGLWQRVKPYINPQADRLITQLDLAIQLHNPH